MTASELGGGWRQRLRMSWNRGVGSGSATRGQQPASSNPGTPAMGGWAWQLKTEEVGHWHVGSTAQCRSVGSNGVQSISKINLNWFKQFQNHSNFDRLKKDLPELKKFEIEYGFEVFE
jgi:hypothetical protein